MVITAPFTAPSLLVPWIRLFCQGMFFGDEKVGVLKIHESPRQSIQSLRILGVPNCAKQHKCRRNMTEPLRGVQMSQGLNFPNSSNSSTLFEGWKSPYLYTRLGVSKKQIEVCMRPDCRCLPSDIPSMKLH